MGLTVVAISIYDVSWVGSSPRSPVPASLHLSALQLKWNLSGMSAAERPHFTPSVLFFDPGNAKDRSMIGRGVFTTPPFVGQLYRCSTYCPAPTYRTIDTPCIDSTFCRLNQLSWLSVSWSLGTCVLFKDKNWGWQDLKHWQYFPVFHKTHRKRTASSS